MQWETQHMFLGFTIKGTQCYITLKTYKHHKLLNIFIDLHSLWEVMDIKLVHQELDSNISGFKAEGEKIVSFRMSHPLVLVY